MTRINDHAEFCDEEPRNPYAAIMTFDVERERERNYYRENERMRRRMKALHKRRAKGE